ncbi:MAG: hypothetical protein KY396_07085, partial [Actinobacteria bacterium]|nr:hypothetical protein [Actinomycetota bacterium]
MGRNGFVRGAAVAAALAAAVVAAPAGEARVVEVPSTSSICGTSGIATKTWDGGAGTTSWHDAANWSPDGVPGVDDHVCIPEDASGDVTVRLTTTATVKSIEVGETLDIAGGGTLDLTDATQLSTVTGALVMS